MVNLYQFFLQRGATYEICILERKRTQSVYGKGL